MTLKTVTLGSRFFYFTMTPAPCSRSMIPDTNVGGNIATIKLDERVPHDHPLRSIKTLFDQALTHIDWKLSLIYSERGRESIPPERLLRALLLQILFSI
ncbi:hypothetical protein [Oceanobacter sp. 1_MG-2023]|uniref:hypothetical protein n=1 Tax=unclassified Oceanobacter TaxID=2620260 RepID=UPI00351F19BC